MTNLDFLDRLAALRTMSCENMPTPDLAILTRTTARLRRSGIDGRCLQVGETAPDFALDDGRTLYELLETGPCVLNFFRGLWCSFCKTELEAYQQIAGELSRLGCHYLAISPESRAAEDDAGYSGVYDRDNHIAARFGLTYDLTPAEIELFQRWGLNLETGALPLPATYVIARDHAVAYRFVDVDFRARCCPDELLRELASQVNVS